MTERRDLNFAIGPISPEGFAEWRRRHYAATTWLKQEGYVETAPGVWQRPRPRPRPSWWADRRVYAALALVAVGAIAAWIILAAGR